MNKFPEDYKCDGQIKLTDLFPVDEGEWNYAKRLPPVPKDFMNKPIESEDEDEDI